MKTISAFGCIILRNNIFHIHGGTANNKKWYHHWKTLTALPIQSYDLPLGMGGKYFLDILTALTTGIDYCSWKLERFDIFLIAIIQFNKVVESIKDVRL